jgi:hypothetical protein
MKRWIALIVLVGSLWAGPAAMAGGERAARLQFEQICPSDASIAPFALEIGSGVRSTRSTIFVTPETFDEVWSSLKRASGPVRNPCPTGTLRVTYSESGKLVASYTIYPDAMLPLIVQLMRMLCGRPL